MSSSSKRPLPIYASTSLKEPPPSSRPRLSTSSDDDLQQQQHKQQQQHQEVNHNTGRGSIETDGSMMDIDKIEPATATATATAPIATTTTTTTTNNNNNNNNNGDDNDVPLVLAPSYQLPIGSRVVFHNLVHATGTSLNGHFGIIEGYLTDQCRYKVRPLARAAKKLTKSKYVSIRPPNLKRIAPSTFIATISKDLNPQQQHKQQHKQQQQQRKIPLECHVTWSDDPNPQDQQLIVQLRYSDCFGTKQELIRRPDDDNNNDNNDNYNNNDNDNDNDDNDIFVSAVNTRIDYDEHVSPDQWLNGHEILILSHKVLYGQLYDAMLDYEVIEEIEDLQVYVGLNNGDVPLCRLKFPYEGCNSIMMDMDDKDNNNNNINNIGGGGGRFNENNNKDDYQYHNDDENNKNDNNNGNDHYDNHNDNKTQNGIMEEAPSNHDDNGEAATNNDGNSTSNDDQVAGEPQSNKRLKEA